MASLLKNIFSQYAEHGTHHFAVSIIRRK